MAVWSPPNHLRWQQLIILENKETKLMKKISLILVLLSLCLFAHTIQAQTLEVSQYIKAIQEAIIAKGANWTAGETSISKLSSEEKKRMLGGRFTIDEILTPDNISYMQADLLTKFDWRNYNNNNWVTPIKNQTICGSCWAMASMASVESRIMIWADEPTLLPDFSEQYLISCAGIGSCDLGGFCFDAYEYMKNSGVCGEICFPYLAENAPCIPCWDYQNRLVKIKDWYYVGGSAASTNVEAIKIALGDGPVSTPISVYADFDAYSGGIYEHVYGDYEGGHCVTLVGWDDTTTPPCWIAKNSWGLNWGEDGFFRIKMGVNECGIEQETTSPEPLALTPIADAGADQTVEQDSYDGGYVCLDGSGSSDPQGLPLTYTWAWDSSTATGEKPCVTLPLGSTTVTLTVSNGYVTNQNEVVIMVIDTKAPVINSLTASPATIQSGFFPQMVDVTITSNVTDICDKNPTCKIIEVTCNQSWWNEAEITGDMTLKVNNKNLFRFQDKIFTITVQCTDASGNVSNSATTTVTVQKGFFNNSDSRRGFREARR